MERRYREEIPTPVCADQGVQWTSVRHHVTGLPEVESRESDAGGYHASARQCTQHALTKLGFALAADTGTKLTDLLTGAECQTGLSELEEPHAEGSKTQMPSQQEQFAVDEPETAGTPAWDRLSWFR